MEMVIPARDHGSSTYRYTWDEDGEVTQITRVSNHTRLSSTSRRQTGIRNSTHWPLQRISTTTANTEFPNGDGTSSSPTTTRTSHIHLNRQRPPTTATTNSIATSTWQPTPLLGIGLSNNNNNTRHNRTSNNSQTSSTSSSTTSSEDRTALVPEYVRSFLRGDTPESVSQQQQHRAQSTTPHQAGSSKGRLYGVSDGGVGGLGGVVGLRTASPQHRGVDFVPAGPTALLHRSRAAEFEGFHLQVGFEEDGCLGEELGEELGRVDSRDSGPGDGEGGDGEGGEGQRFLGAEGEDGAGTGRWRGWRAGIAVNVLVAFVVLVVGFVCLIVAISGVALEAGRSAFFVGDCEVARGVDWGLHAAIGVVVVVLVAAANYAFQVLSSPTRDEVTAAHRRGEWLDIGVPSFRNLARVEGSRTFLAGLVLVTAVCTQIMYNAVIFVSQTAPNFKAAVVTEAFLRGAPFNNDISNNIGRLSRTDILALQQQAGRGELVRLTTSTCINQFSGDFQQEYSAVLLVSSLNNPALIQTAEGASMDTIADLVSDLTTIQQCLAQPAPAPTCEVNLNASLLGSVALLNSIAIVATAAILFKRPSSFRPLATFGDAISSFLEEPDPTTQGACLLSKSDIWQGRWPLTEAKYWVPRNHSWLRSVSVSRWIATFSLWLAAAGLAAAGLAFAIAYDPTTRLTPFGTASPHTLIPLTSTTPAAAAAVVASLPQLLLALLYIATNSLLTTYYLSHESSLFAASPPRPLRVSADPVGAQTTSLYLTLPHTVSALLMALFAAMSFILSQSFFPVAVRLVEAPLTGTTNPPTTTTTPSPLPTTTLTALGLSSTALLTLLSSLLLLALGILALGLRRAPFAGLHGFVADDDSQTLGNPMALPAGSCSAVLSARCHPLAREKGLWMRPVMWGVVREGVGLGVSHCGFTAGRAGEVRAGGNYA